MPADTSEPATTHGLLAQDPPPAVLRAGGWLIIALFTAFVIGAAVVPFPETVRCPFELTPEGGADPVQSPHQSVVDQVRITEMQEVAAGDALFILRSDEIRRRDTELRTLTEEVNTREQAVEKLEAAHTAQIGILDEQIRQGESELVFRKEHTATHEEMLTKLKGLARTGVISQVELVRQELEFSESRKDLHIAQRALEQARLLRQKTETERTRARTGESAEITKLKLQIAALTGDMKNAEGNLLTIRAPYDAIVISLEQRNPGSVIAPGDVLCQLAPVNAVPIARLTLPEQGLPRLESGQPARLYFNAFPYQRYGTVPATLDWISPAAVLLPEGRRFTAAAKLQQTTVHTHGKESPLLVGMRGEASIRVGARTLLEYAFQPLRQLRESLRHD